MKVSTPMRLLRLAVLALTLSTFGCTLSMGIGLPDILDLQNAHIESLRHVSATSSKYGILSPPQFNQQMLDLAVDSALKKKGADVLLNMRITTELTNYIFPIYKIVLRVEGMAAKVTPIEPVIERSQVL